MHCLIMRMEQQFEFHQASCQNDLIEIFFFFFGGGVEEREIVLKRKRKIQFSSILIYLDLKGGIKVTFNNLISNFSDELSKCCTRIAFGINTNIFVWLNSEHLSADYYQPGILTCRILFFIIIFFPLSTLKFRHFLVPCPGDPNPHKN